MSPAENAAILGGSVFPEEEQPSLRNWAIAAGVVLLAHAAFVYWVLHRPQATSPGAPPEVVMVELAPVPTATPQAETQPDVPPSPQMTESEPEEAVETPQTLAIPELPKLPKPAADLETAPRKPQPRKKVVPNPVVKHTREPPSPRTSAPPHASAASAASAGRPGAAGSSISPSTWMSEVHARIQAHHSYPPGAEGQKGTARVAFSINRAGQILSASIVGSSGSAALDQAALATIRRSSPLPPPPAEIGGRLTIPVGFH